jgi:hypothetical protein
MWDLNTVIARKERASFRILRRSTSKSMLSKVPRCSKIQCNSMWIFISLPLPIEETEKHERPYVSLACGTLYRMWHVFWCVFYGHSLFGLGNVAPCFTNSLYSLLSSLEEPWHFVSLIIPKQVGLTSIRPWHWAAQSHSRKSNCVQTVAPRIPNLFLLAYPVIARHNWFVFISY